MNLYIINIVKSGQPSVCVFLEVNFVFTLYVFILAVDVSKCISIVHIIIFVCERSCALMREDGYRIVLLAT